jgi:hypothetical protein
LSPVIITTGPVLERHTSLVRIAKEVAFTAFATTGCAPIVHTARRVLGADTQSPTADLTGLGEVKVTIVGERGAGILAVRAICCAYGWKPSD